MANYSDAVSVHQTLSGTTVDRVALDRGRSYEITNRVGESTIWYTQPSHTIPDDPTAAGAGLGFVRTGECVVVDFRGFNDKQTGPVYIKLLGDGNAYSVEVLP